MCAFTPGGTRIIYDRDYLLHLKNSPASKVSTGILTLSQNVKLTNSQNVKLINSQNVKLTNSKNPKLTNSQNFILTNSQNFKNTQFYITCKLIF